jgi:hypothetical protein
METVRIRDPGWKKVGSGVRDKHPGSATLDEALISKFVILFGPVCSAIYIFILVFCLVRRTPSQRVQEVGGEVVEVCVDVDVVETMRLCVFSPLVATPCRYLYGV